LSGPSRDAGTLRGGQGRDFLGLLFQLTHHFLFSESRAWVVLRKTQCNCAECILGSRYCQAKNRPGPK
jgi:hypothetical protein